MQEDGLTPPADLQAQAIASGKMEDTMFVTGHALFDFIHSNQLVAMQKLVPDEAQHHDDPEPEGREARPVPEAVDAASPCRASAADPEAAAKLMNFFITDDSADRHPARSSAA